MIQDSGDRREFETGAVRDMQEGKGRCDLLPLGAVAAFLDDDPVLTSINLFMALGDNLFLYDALSHFTSMEYDDEYTTILEVAKHYEEGCKKYGERNWEKGIPAHSFVDSAVRHYLKWARGDVDERHDRAFVWNILGLIWTLLHHPEMNDLPFKDALEEALNGAHKDGDSGSRNSLVNQYLFGNSDEPSDDNVGGDTSDPVYTIKQGHSFVFKVDDEQHLRDWRDCVESAGTGGEYTPDPTYTANCERLDREKNEV